MNSRVVLGIVAVILIGVVALIGVAPSLIVSPVQEDVVQEPRGMGDGVGRTSDQDEPPGAVGSDGQPVAIQRSPVGAKHEGSAASIIESQIDALAKFYEKEVIEEYSDISADGRITYSVEKIPETADAVMLQRALHSSFGTWERLNPGLVFEESEEPEIMIQWKEGPGDHWVGRADCMRSTVIHSCVVIISIGGTSCGGEYVHAGFNDVTNTIMHELGHVLGIGHINDMEHLMYGTDAPATGELDARGYVIPDELETHAVRNDRERMLIEEEKEELDARESVLEMDLEKIEQLRNEYSQYEGRTLPEPQYSTSQELLAQIQSQTADYNARVQELNDDVDELNQRSERLLEQVELSNALTGDPCYHLHN